MVIDYCERYLPHARRPLATPAVYLVPRSIETGGSIVGSHAEVEQLSRMGRRLCQNSRFCQPNFSSRYLVNTHAGTRKHAFI